MLLEQIRNFYDIDELDLTLAKGLNVLTGETGAGKSIILSAVQLLLGDKASEDWVRGEEEEAVVEALFDLSGNREVREKVKERASKSHSAGEEELLLIRRVISRAGRGKALFNGHLATLGMLSEIGEELLSIYGQHEHQSLQRVETHIDILDEFGELLGLREEFQNNFQKFVSLSEEVKRIREEKDKKARERELMAFQSKEIEASKVQIGEEGALKEERNILLHAKKLMEFATDSEAALYSDKGSVIIRDEEKSMKSLEAPLVAGLGLFEKVEINPAHKIENRLEEMDRLKRKYGNSVEAILLFKKKTDEALRSFTDDEERLSRLEEALAPLEGEVGRLAKKLSGERKRVALALRKSVEKELGSLGMKKTTFEVRIDPVSMAPKGSDRVEFLISPNIGEEVKPLAKIASGGELSRIMLAMKRILAKVGGMQVLIFDEVDSGIGGAIAEVVGRKLKELSMEHQVICVTHLPQIACFADNHHSVRKRCRKANGEIGEKGIVSRQDLSNGRRLAKR
jgi:DNA repair protein RecN (Recombination protein N)